MSVAVHRFAAVLWRRVDVAAPSVAVGAAASMTRTFSSPAEAPWMVSNMEAKAVEELRNLMDEDKVSISGATTSSTTPAPTPSGSSDGGAEAGRKEVGGPKGQEPTRFGDWEQNGRCTDF
uniref:Succinate dehydrogenase assembly factor 4, mitochondrial n=1 Tax=Tetraselmis chuii TaxID=63592 RepID=A0A7S1SPU6_9CHLO|mmetsp:Transcript_23250/g.41304  ORF Transcript_23250/g.41304 Transcript_23250/m.41304 type:complete len:120 (+) Transcript_23250:191-550(+)